MIITAILASCFLLFVVVPYEISHYQAPSCSDHKQNQGELGVDCEGPCSLLCVGTAQELKILWSKIFLVRSGSYDFATYVENPNINIAAKRIPYTVKLYDAEGELITERKSNTFAKPNERFAVFEGGIDTGDKVPVKGEITFDAGIVWQKVSVPNSELSIANKVLTSPNSRPRLSALLKNSSEASIRNVLVTAVIYDSNGNAVGASETKIEKVDHNSDAKLFFTWDKPFNYNAEFESCESPVDVLLALDRSGSMTSDGRNPPQPLTQAIQAAAQFIDRMTMKDQAGYISFATDASNPIDETLTGDFGRIKNTILNTEIHAGGTQYTNIGDAFMRARDEFQTQRRNDDARAIVVLLTDGVPTYPKDAKNPKYAEQYGQSLAEALKRDGVTIYTIGLGEEVNKEYLLGLASAPENNYIATNGKELAGVYQQIATAICQKGPSVIEVIPRINDIPDPI